MAKVEFFNDGVRDRVSGAPAPAIFLDQLNREMQIASREERPLTVLSIVSLNEEFLLRGILSMTKLIEKNLRRGDFYTRISENGFWLCIRGDLQAARNVVERLGQQKPGENPDWRVIPFPLDLSVPLDAQLQRIDRIHFQ
jgi:hypothetical protein